MIREKREEQRLKRALKNQKPIWYREYPSLDISNAMSPRTVFSAATGTMRTLSPSPRRHDPEQELLMLVKAVEAQREGKRSRSASYSSRTAPGTGGSRPPAARLLDVPKESCVTISPQGSFRVGVSASRLASRTSESFSPFLWLLRTKNNRCSAKP